ncbi:MAG: hypothetical protein KME35_07795 [Aphanocapsa sp. GSE-SYN-MK-11-07L]|jgi:hypothetical protein|nr:hypothetical protein [Aphanocapsa sp. GSE-SYN-MK-11-07L]
MNKTFAILPLIALTSLSVALSLPLKANALEVRLGFPHYRGWHPHNVGPRYDNFYSVYYRRPEVGRWYLAGTYRNPYKAQQAVYDLRQEGYIARVEKSNRFW